MALPKNLIINSLKTDKKFSEIVDIAISDKGKRATFLDELSSAISTYDGKASISNMKDILMILDKNGIDKETFKDISEMLNLPKLELQGRDEAKTYESLKEEEYEDKSKAQSFGDSVETVKKDLIKDGRDISIIFNGAKRTYQELTKDTDNVGLKALAILGVSVGTVTVMAADIGLRTAFNVARSITKFTAKTAARTYKAARGTAEKKKETLYNKKMKLGKEILDKAEQEFEEDRADAIIDLEGVDVPENIQNKLDEMRDGKFTELEQFEEFETRLSKGMSKQTAAMKENIESVRQGAVRIELQKAGFDDAQISEFLANATIDETGQIVCPQNDDKKAKGKTIDNEFLSKDRELHDKIKRVLNAPSVDELTPEQIEKLSRSIEIVEYSPGKKAIHFDRSQIDGDPVLESFADNIGGKHLYQKELETNVENANKAYENHTMLQKVKREVIATHGLNITANIREDLNSIEQMKTGYDEKEVKQGGLKEEDRSKRMALRKIAAQKVDTMLKKGLAKVIEDGNGQQMVEISKSKEELLHGLDKADSKKDRKLEKAKESYEKDEDTAGR